MGLSRKIVNYFGLFVVAVLAACSGSATVPAPLVELPSVISIPKDLSIDVSLDASEASAVSSSVKFIGGKSGVLGTDLATIIPIGPEFARITNEEILPAILGPFNTFEIPVSPKVKTFEGVLEGEDVLTSVFKFDFSDFDFDSDGINDGFVGCTCPLSCEIETCPKEIPLADMKRVGFRVWIQEAPGEPFVPRMAGFFDRLPIKDDPSTIEDEENPGVGQIRVSTIDEGLEGTDRLLIGIVYNHLDPSNELNKSTQSQQFSDLVSPEGQFLLSRSINILTTQNGKTDTVGKTYLDLSVKTHFEGFESKIFNGVADASAFEKYIGQFRDDKNFWSGSYEANIASEALTLPTTCARITTATAVAEGICVDLGIDSSDEVFLPPTVESNVLLPSDFPPLPPFFLL